MTDSAPRPSQGVRRLRVEDMLPKCEIAINAPAYDLRELARGKNVLDIGCGYGATRKPVEEVGGTWTGVEPFEGGAHTVIASAEALPFGDATFDLVIMDAVLEHVPDASAAFREVARVLKPGGLFVGYVAFMECFHEISYAHLSFKAIEHFAQVNKLILRRITGGGRFGIDYHLAVLLWPLPTGLLARAIAFLIRNAIFLKSRLTLPVLRWRRGLSAEAATKLANDYYTLEVLRQSVGFGFVIERPNAC